MEIKEPTGVWTTEESLGQETYLQAVDQLPVHGGGDFFTAHADHHGGRYTVLWIWHPSPQVKKFYDFTLVAQDPASPKGQKVLMDGVMLKGVTRVKVVVGVKQANKITITFIAGSINKE